ncbi:MAG: DMT family transporter [Deltaproteobacteria bacterium]|nr:DMT family transporter [Deltaproteobacteria bacterium]
MGEGEFQEADILPYLALTATSLLFGLSFVATKFALKSIPPFTLIFLRFFLALLFLGVIYFRKSRTPLLPGDRWRLFLVSLIVPGLYFLAETYGLKLSSATSVSLLISTIPIFAAIFAFFLMGEKVGIWRAGGIFLSIAGVGIIVAAGGHGLEMERMIQAGNLLGLGAALCAGLYLAMGRDLMARYSPLTITTFQALFTVALFLPLAGWEQWGHRWDKVQPLTLLAVVYLALFCSVLAFFLWNYGISRLEASKAAVFTNLVPVFTVVGAYGFLGERIQPDQIIGGALVIAGVSLASATRGNNSA